MVRNFCRLTASFQIKVTQAVYLFSQFLPPVLTGVNRRCGATIQFTADFEAVINAC